MKQETKIALESSMALFIRATYNSSRTYKKSVTMSEAEWEHIQYFYNARATTQGRVKLNRYNAYQALRPERILHGEATDLFYMHLSGRHKRMQYDRFQIQCIRHLATLKSTFGARVYTLRFIAALFNIEMHTMRSIAADASIPTITCGIYDVFYDIKMLGTIASPTWLRLSATKELGYRIVDAQLRHKPIRKQGESRALDKPDTL